MFHRCFTEKWTNFSMDKGIVGRFADLHFALPCILKHNPCRAWRENMRRWCWNNPSYKWEKRLLMRNRFSCARLVYKPSSVLNGHLSRRYVAVALKRLFGAGGQPICSVSCIRWGLHHASSPICGWALTSPFHPYPTSWAVFFCCTFLEVTFTGISPAPLPYDARTFLTVFLPRDRPANSLKYNNIFICLLQQIRLILMPNYILH